MSELMFIGSIGSGSTYRSISVNGTTTTICTPTRPRSLFDTPREKKVTIPTRQLTQYVNGNTPFTNCYTWKDITVTEIIKTVYKKK